MVTLNFSTLFLFLFLLFFQILLFALLALEHFIILLIFLDLLLLVNILLLILNTQLTGHSLGYNYALLLLGVAAADTAVGLGIFILYFKTQGSTSLQ